MNTFFPRVCGAAVAAALTLFLATPALAEEPEDPPLAPAPPKSLERPFEAERAPHVIGREISVPLTGLSERNRDDVLGELETLVEEMGLIISQHTPDLETSTIAFSLPKHGEFRLSDLEITLEPTGAQINFDTLEIPQGSRLVFLGPADEGGAGRLCRTLERARLCESFTVETDEDFEETTVVADLVSPVRYSTLLKTLEGVDSGHELVDFVWVNTPTPKV